MYIGCLKGTLVREQEAKRVPKAKDSSVKLAPSHGFSETPETLSTSFASDKLLEEALLMNFQKKYKEALHLTEQAIQLHTQTGNQVELVKCLVEHAWLKYSNESADGVAKAIRLFNDASEKIRELQHEPGVSEIRGKLLHYKGLIRYKQGLYGQAVRLLKEAQTYCDPDKLEAAKILDSLAIYYEEIGNFSRALKLLKQSLDIKQEAGPQYEEAITLQILGRLCLSLEQLEEAQDFLAQAKGICAKLNDEKRYASLYNDLIKIRILQSELDKAAAMIEEAELSNQNSKLSSQYGTTLLYKTYVAFIRQDFQRAETLLKEEVLPLFEKHPNKKGYGIALRLRGALYQVYGQRTEAIESMTQAIAVFNKQRRMDELAKTHYELGKLYGEMNQFSLARDTLLEGLRIAEDNSLTFLVQPIEDEIFRLDTDTWQDIVDKRVKHEPIFKKEPSLFEKLSSLPEGDMNIGGTIPGIEGLSKTKSLVSLLRVGQAMAAERELEPLLKLIKDETEEALEAERCTVFVYDRDTNELWSRVASGLDSTEEIRFPAHMGLAGYVVKTGDKLNIPDAYADPRFNKDVDKKTGYRTRNLLCIPILNRRGDTVGVFQVLNKKEKPFGKDDEDLLMAISANAGIMIENAMLAQEQKQNFDGFVRTLSATIDARDPITAGHSERVSDLSLLIGDEMSMESSDLEALKYAALLHDIGKIGIREEVLVKDGRLTIEEYKHIQEHARYTYEILQNIHFERHLRTIPEIAASHHEKMDGTGYFRNLKGVEIPLSGRILAIADVFDAITSRRHYRNRMPFDKVLKIIQKDAGTHFDPDCVELLFRVPLYKVAEVLVKERLFEHVSSVASLTKALDKRVTLEEFQLVLAKPHQTKAEKELVDLFTKLYYVLPVTENDKH